MYGFNKRGTMYWDKIKDPKREALQRLDARKDDAEYEVKIAEEVYVNMLTEWTLKQKAQQQVIKEAQEVVDELKHILAVNVIGKAAVDIKDKRWDSLQRLNTRINDAEFNVKIEEDVYSKMLNEWTLKQKAQQQVIKEAQEVVADLKHMLNTNWKEYYNTYYNTP